MGETISPSKKSIYRIKLSVVAHGYLPVHFERNAYEWCMEIQPLYRSQGRSWLQWTGMKFTGLQTPEINLNH